LPSSAAMAAAAADSRQHLANPGRGEAHTRHGDGDRCHRPPAAVQRHTNGDDCSFPLTAVSPYLRLLVVLRSRRRRASSSEPNPSSGTLDGGRAGRTLRRAGQPERLCRRTSDGREEQRRCATRGLLSASTLVRKRTSREVQREFEVRHRRAWLVRAIGPFSSSRT
jgi:hypothetical protein